LCCCEGGGFREEGGALWMSCIAAVLSFCLSLSLSLSLSLLVPLAGGTTIGAGGELGAMKHLRERLL
jgi:hypothetical protein